MAEDSIPGYKRCGFVCAVLQPVELCPNSTSVEVGTHCETWSEPGFKSETGVLLKPIVRSGASAMDVDVDRVGEFSGDEGGLDWGRIIEKGATGKRKNYKKKKVETKRTGKMGTLHGTVSVIHQIHSLVTKKCLKILARVIGIRTGDDGGGGGEEVRVVVLVDVYLPTSFWAGAQFQKCKLTAAALFRHLSCNWRKRSDLLGGQLGSRNYAYEEANVWHIGDCHALGCKQHLAPDSSKRKQFQLHKVFKSIPSLEKEGTSIVSRILPDIPPSTVGIWDLADDIVDNILSMLSPLDLIRVSSTCRHLRSLGVSIMPCVKLKLYPHQQAAVEWMIKREQEASAMPHPLYSEFSTEDGFSFYMNIVSGEILCGADPTIKDFRGGMFCDEPGLGKTVTALTLILKTLGTIADPPEGAHVTWCTQNGYQKCGYYECDSNSQPNGTVSSPDKRSVGLNGRSTIFCYEELLPRHETICRTPSSSRSKLSTTDSRSGKVETKSTTSSPPVIQTRRSLDRIKSNLLPLFEGNAELTEDLNKGGRLIKRKHVTFAPVTTSMHKSHLDMYVEPINRKKQRLCYQVPSVCSDSWVQCDSCQKWRKVPDDQVPNSNQVWFCSMNLDPLYQGCSTPEDSWDRCAIITYFPGFCDTGTSGELPQNIAFFASVLKEHFFLFNSQTRKDLIWLARLTPAKLSEMATTGLVRAGIIDNKNAHSSHNLFQAFGLKKKVEKGVVRWFYPESAGKFDFDVAALRRALIEPFGAFRVYLSRATLIVVPSNLVDHWKSQIQKHVRPGQLRVYVWTDNKKPSAHCLAWDYDVVITTFTRLSAEWDTHKRSAMRLVHWRRVMLDEGHTLGSSLSLTNKLQMAISLTASTRWLLTGTPTPNTPNSQLSNLQPMFKFLHEEVYGPNPKSWDAAVLKPFEAEMEEGRLRLLELLSRCMISARKSDLRCIPPCMKKTVFVNFTEEHAKTYNELVVTVRRNILMADWNDPSHVESLLNPKQWKFRSNTVRNVRLSCCVAGHIKVTEAGQDIQETMDVLAEKGLDPLSVEYAFIKYNLINGGNCQRCNVWCRLPVVTPCKHLLCLDCVALDSEKCTLPGCGGPYEMQSPETLARPENPNPKWSVPKDLIELQPSYKQDNWDPDWQSTSSSKVSYLIKRLNEIQDASCQNLDSSSSQSRDCSMLYSGILVGKADPHEATVEKVLIFSQFLEHIHVITQQLTIAGIKHVAIHSPMPTPHKMKSLTVFQQDSTCMALVMDGTAALGLDLSFVSHVFLMEPIWDRSMEEQVISRAHRMGATRPIQVETLAMHGTIEEQMLEFLQNADDCRRLLKEEDVNTDVHGGKAHRSLHDFAERNYLARLSSVRTSKAATQ